MDNKTIGNGLGCLGAIVLFGVVQPAWFVLLYRLLDATDQPAWVWGIYWAYVPIAWMVAIAGKLGESIAKVEK